MATAKELEDAKLVVFRKRLAQFSFAHSNNTRAYVRMLDTDTSAEVALSALSVASKERWDEVELRHGWQLKLKGN